jgi:hypothetical protein
MKATRQSPRDLGNHSLIFDTAKLDGLTEDFRHCYLNVLIDAGSRTIVHSWISLKSPDARDLQKELTRFVFK